MYRNKGLGGLVSGKRAFTLLEVVIAMLLLGIGLLALMTLQIRSIRSNTFSNCLTLASSFARNEVEDLRSHSWENIADGTVTETLRDMERETGAARMVFTRERFVQTDASGRLKDVTVTVSWEQDGRPHQIAVSTRIARRQ